MFQSTKEEFKPEIENRKGYENKWFQSTKEEFKLVGSAPIT